MPWLEKLWKTFFHLVLIDKKPWWKKATVLAQLKHVSSDQNQGKWGKTWIYPTPLSTKLLSCFFLRSGHFIDKNKYQRKLNQKVRTFDYGTKFYFTDKYGKPLKIRFTRGLWSICIWKMEKISFSNICLPTNCWISLFPIIFLSYLSVWKIIV